MVRHVDQKVGVRPVLHGTLEISELESDALLFFHELACQDRQPPDEVWNSNCHDFSCVRAYVTRLGLESILLDHGLDARVSQIVIVQAGV